MPQDLETSPGDTLDRLKILVETLDRENDRFWRRNTVFVTISAGLLALVAGYIDKIGPLMGGFITLFGFVVSLAWVQVTTMGKHYWNRFARDIEHLLESHPNYADTFVSLT